MFEIDWRGLLLPLAYLVVLGGTFMTFSTVYRKRKARMSALSPYISGCGAMQLLETNERENWRR
jgi:hypothetical protein